MCQPRDAGLAHELPLDALLSQYVFSSAAITTIAPDAQDAAGFDAYLRRFKKALAAEREAVAQI